MRRLKILVHAKIHLSGSDSDASHADRGPVSLFSKCASHKIVRAFERYHELNGMWRFQGGHHNLALDSNDEDEAPAKRTLESIETELDDVRKILDAFLASDQVTILRPGQVVPKCAVFPYYH